MQKKTLLFIFQGGDISVFETNIRYVGGLLSAYALTGDDLFREKALHVAEKLTPAFKSPTGIPFALINMRTGVSMYFYMYFYSTQRAGQKKIEKSPGKKKTYEIKQIKYIFFCQIAILTVLNFFPLQKLIFGPF